MFWFVIQNIFVSLESNVVCKPLNENKINTRNTRRDSTQFDNAYAYIPHNMRSTFTVSFYTDKAEL